MANTSEQLSDKTVVIDFSELLNSCETLKSRVLSSDMNSFDATKSFKSFIDNGIGTSYFSSLNKALKDLEETTLSVNNIIATAIKEQSSLDEAGTKKSKEDKYTPPGSTSGSQNNNKTTTNHTKIKGKVNIVKDNKNEELDKNSLPESEVVKVLSEFHNIYNGDIYDALYNDKSAENVKKVLLKSPNLSDDLKDKISKLDDSKLQEMIKKPYLSAQMMSNFSKAVITSFDNDLKSNGKENLFDISKNASKVYTNVAKSKDPQKELYKLYCGDSSLKDVDDSTIEFTRKVVDIIATAANVSYEDVLTSSDYKETISIEMKNIADAFAVIYGSTSEGKEVTDSLYSNIVTK